MDQISYMRGAVAVRYGYKRLGGPQGTWTDWMRATRVATRRRRWMKRWMSWLFVLLRKGERQRDKKARHQAGTEAEVWQTKDKIDITRGKVDIKRRCSRGGVIDLVERWRV